MTTPDAPARVAALRERLLALGGAFVELPILQPADVFIELAGEDFRRRLFTVGGSADGAGELCLRPDFTIPTCLKHLGQHGAGAPRPARYAYLGPVFRQARRSGAPEFVQAGVEWIDIDGSVTDDAAILDLALKAAAALGLERPALRVGDADIFAAVVGALPLSDGWRRKLIAAFGHTPRLKRALARLEGGEAPTTTLAQRLGVALSGVDAADARAIVEAVVDLPAIAPVGGRGADEIAERILELSATRPDPDARAAAAVLREVLAIACPLGHAVAGIERCVDAAGIAIGDALERLAARVAAIEALGVDVDAARFSVGFGRELDYYTGFVFELDDPAQPDAGPMIGGGRYDRLFTMLGAARPVAATGFAVWLDRFGIEVPGGSS